MKKILILYASSTGNTEEIACLMRTYINPKEFEVTRKNIELDNMDLNFLLNYDGILFGTYTYDDGDLPFETAVFCDSLENVDLSGKVIGVFGSGDAAYSQFCEAVDLMKEKFRHMNATVIDHTVKVDLFPNLLEDLTSIKKLTDQFLKTLSNSITTELFKIKK
ncbi:flavodoxin I [Planomicrobium stackebrandtii]|uniref:Flavodoxin I n=1 Tax=Planomicrobium stackebrandtii TaxID=253160 RepID=A0ABU0GPD1_9BACL|nr:flavodoxin domain-containing protein [Planomicrobium stackebrandtii]MDQ0427217.1 flavodoxin I [Planomicrobium stackebrandtii]